MDSEILYVYVDAFGADWLPALHTCAERSPEWLVARTPNIDSANLILGITPQPEEDTATYLLAELAFVLAVNTQNPLSDLEIEELQAIYTGRVSNWAELGGDDAPIQVWGYNADTGLNEILLKGGALSSLAYQAQTPEAMRDALVNDPAAVGLMPLEIVNAEGQIRRISSEEMIVPLLIFVPQEDPALNSLLACLQEK